MQTNWILSVSRLSAVLACLIAGVPAFALINASFTPVDLVKKAENIASASASADAENNTLTLRISATLKGKQTEITKLHVGDLLENEDFAYYFKEVGSFPVVILQGDFTAAKDDAKGNTAAVIHVGASWYGVVKTKDGYKLAPDQLDLKAVWDGGHEPLVRAVQYVLKSRLPRIPATVGVEWDQVRVLQKLPGSAGEPAAAFDGKQHTLLWPSDQGDWLITINPEGRVTSQNLPTKSLAVTRVDLNQDGSDEWLGTDGKRIYEITAKDSIDRLTGLQGITALSPATVDGSPGLLAVTPNGPILATWKNGKTAIVAVTNQPLENVRQACMFDADADGLADIVIATDEKVLLAAGRKDGGFAKPVEAGSIYKIGLNRMSAGDFNGDGHMDLLLTGSAEYGVILLAGDGKGGFADTLTEAGELQYHGSSATTTSGLCDINNDGLVDLLIVPDRGMPKIMFNRGFRTFGYARELDLAATEIKGANELARGERTLAATMIDLNNDGAQDMLCVSGGQLLAVMRKPRASDLGVTLRTAEGKAGPFSVWANDGERVTGGRVVTSDQPTFIGKNTKGPLDLSGFGPDGSKLKQRVIVLRPTDVKLTTERN